MPFNGSGGFVSVGAPNFPAVDGTTILASQYNTQLNDIFNGLSNAVTRDGQSPATAHLPMGGFNFSNLGDGTTAGRALVYGQTSAASLGGALTVGGNLNLSAVALAAAGSAGAPAFSFTGDPDSGVFSPGANSLGFSAGGVQRGLFTTAGFVVTSAAASDAMLSLQAISYARDWRLKVSNANGGWILRDETGAADRLLVDTSGNWGFSMTPVYKIDVTGTAGNGYRYVGPTAQVLFGEVGNKGAIGTLTNHALDFLTNGSAKMSLAAAGNLTISAPSSGYPLTAEANGTLAALFRNTNAGAVNAGIAFGSPGSNNLSAGIAGLAQSISTGNLIFQYVTGSALTEGARLTSGGLFMINRTADSGLGVLQVNSGGSQVADFSSSVAAAINIRAVTAGTIASVRIAGNGLTPGVGSFDIQQDASGNVDLLNRSNTRLSFYTNGTERFQVSAVGQLFAHAIHNNASGAAGTTPMIASGTYTPTFTNISGTTANTPRTCQWLRVGNVCHVSGNIDVTSSSGAGVSWRLSLPIASDLANSWELAGTAARSGSPQMGGILILGDSTNNEATFSFNNDTNTLSLLYSFTFSYLIK